MPLRMKTSQPGSELGLPLHMNMRGAKLKGREDTKTHTDTTNAK